MRETYQLPDSVVTNAQIKAVEDEIIKATNYFDAVFLHQDIIKKAYQKSMKKSIRKIRMMFLFARIKNFFKGVK